MALYIYQSDLNDFLTHDTAANSKIRRYILNVLPALWKLVYY